MDELNLHPEEWNGDSTFTGHFWTIEYTPLQKYSEMI